MPAFSLGDSMPKVAREAREDDGTVPATSKRGPSGAKDSAGLTPKQRAFVCLIAEGKTQADAYRGAYGKPETYPTSAAAVRGHAVASQPAVRAEIDRMKAEITARVRVAAAAKHAVTVSYVMGALHEVAERCMQHRPVLDGRGNPVMVNVKSPEGEVEVRALYTFDAKGAVGALLPLGKQLGMFIDRKEIRTGPLPDKSDAEVDEAISALLSDLSAATGLDTVTLLRDLNDKTRAPDTARLAPPHPTPQGGSASASWSHPVGNDGPALYAEQPRVPSFQDVK